MYRLFILALILIPSIACGQKFDSSGLRPGESRSAEFLTIQQWQTKLTEIRSKDTRNAIVNAFFNIAKRKDLNQKERAMMREVATKLAELEDDSGAKIAACNMLVYVGDKTTAPIVNKLLADQDANVRSGAIRASHGSHDDDTVTALAGYIAMYGGNSRSIVGGSPIAALVSIGTKDARDVLQSIYNNKTHPDRDDAGKALDILDARGRKKP